MTNRSSAYIFNTVCLAILGVFVLASMWLWRGEIMSAVRSTQQPAVAVSDIMVPVIGEQKAVVPIVTEQEAQPLVQEQEEQRAPETPKNLAQEHAEPSPILEQTVIKNVLPDTINLAVPFTSQAPEGNWDQPWQDACEEAAVLMLDAYYKQYDLSVLFAKEELQDMVDWEEAKSWGGSISIERVQQVTEHYVGTGGRIIQDPTVDQLKGLLAAGHPILAVADGKTLENPYFTNGGPVYHALVIKGYTPTHFITNDPGTRHGADFQYTYDNLISSLKDWNNGDVKQGRAVVMVLE